MKKITIIFFLIALKICSLDEISNNPVQCLLSMSIKEYYYQNISNTVELIINFKSNCMPFSIPVYFELPWETWFDLDGNNFPKKVDLYLFGRSYTINFYDNFRQEYDESYKMLFSKFDLSTSNFGNLKFDIYKHNYFIIQNTGGNYIFEKSVMENFWNMDNPVFCNADNRKLLVCEITLSED